MILYKYREDAPRTEEILTTGKVWLSTASNLNDPVECRTGLIPPAWRREQIRHMQLGHMAGFIQTCATAIEKRESFYSLSFRNARRWFEKFKRLKSHKQKYAAARSFLESHNINLSRPELIVETFQSQLAKVGIFSLSERPDNDPMWAHYSGNHTGLMIGFKSAPNNKLGSSEHTLAVTYSNEKPVFGDGFINKSTLHDSPTGGLECQQSIGFSDPTFRAAFSTKPVHWSYEKEWRYVEESGGLFPWPGPIVSVTFGLKMPVDRRRHYMSIVAASQMSGSIALYEIAYSKSGDSLRHAPYLAR